MPRRISGQTANGSRSVLDTYVDEIGNTVGWNAIVQILCEHFKLPDLSTRSGLKKVHARFNEIFTKLDKAYSTNKGNDKIMGGIVGIWAKMSADVLLRDKLFKQGLVAKMVPLLDMPATRYLGLQTLSSVTHNGGIAARQEIAKLAPTLVRIMNEFPDDPRIIELATTTLSHSIGAVVSQNKAPDPKLLAALDMRSVLKTTIDNMRKPTASHLMADHGLGLLTGSTLHCYKECRALPPVITFLVACLRSNDLTTRCNALGGLVRLSQAEAEPDIHFYDPQKMISAVQRQFPDHLADIMMDYGMQKCDTVLTLVSTRDFQAAMMKCVQDRNMYILGKTIAGLVLRTEFSIAEGMWQAYDEKTGKAETMDVGLPFVMWTDSMPYCARALREKGTPADLDAADVVEMKYHIAKKSISNAVAVGKKAIARNPQLAYAYYVVALGADNAQGLKAVKKGLKCKQITPFVRHYLLWRAIEHAGNMGVTVLQEAVAGEKDYVEGLAFLMSSCEDAKTFIAQAPPDNRNMQTVLNWYIICTIAIRGSGLSPELKELDDALKRLETADQFANFLGYPPKRTQMRLTRQLIIKNYPAAIKLWGEVVKRIDKMDSTPETRPIPSTSEAEDDLAAWLEDLHVGEDENANGPRRCGHPRISTNSVELYRCSYCSNPSAILRKCGNCGKTRYCDAGCQKLHWNDHKRICKTDSSQA